MLNVTQLSGFGIGGGTAAYDIYRDQDIFYRPDISRFMDTWAMDLTSGYASWSAYSIRLVLNASMFALNGTSHVRVWLHGYDYGTPGNGPFIEKIYFGEQAASGDVYDMKDPPPPIRMTRSGANSFQLGANAEPLDEFSFVFDKTKNYVISWWISGTGIGSTGLRYKDGVSGMTSMAKFAVDDAAAGDTTGFAIGGGSSTGVGRMILVSKIQVR